jgi:hypothetical protein
MRRFAPACIVVLAAVLPARADILPPNSKWVTHVARFTNIAEHREYVFYVYPRDLSRGHPGNSSVRVPESGEVAISGLNPLAAGGGVFLFAIPRTLHGLDTNVAKEEWFEGNVVGVLKSGPLVYPVRSLPSTDPRDRIVTSYRVEIKDGLKLVEAAPNPEQALLIEASSASVVPAESTGFRRWRWIGACAAAGLAIGFAAWIAVRKKV